MLASNQTGSLWNATIGSAVTYHVGETRFAVTTGGEVFREAEHGTFVPATEAEQAEVQALLLAEARVPAARREYATVQAKGNSALAEAIFLGCWFANGEPTPATFGEVPGATFFQVGRNSTHAFYAGANAEGERFYLSTYYGETLEVSHRKLGAFAEVGYWGHC